MALQLVRDKPKQGKSFVAISSKYFRIHLYTKTYDLAVAAYGKDFDHVQFYLDDERSDRFWIKPCPVEAPSSKQIHLVKKSRVISAASLLNELNWRKDKGTIRYPAYWDEEYEAIMVDLSHPHE